MDRMLQKFAQKYKRAQEEVNEWNNTQLQFLSLLGNAIAIIERFPIIMDAGNYGALKKVDGLESSLLVKQVATLENIFLSLHETLDDFKKIKESLERLWRESIQILKAEKVEPASKQAQKRFGVGPNLNECVDGLANLFIMHRDEYQLKNSGVRSLSYNSRPMSEDEVQMCRSAADMGALQYLLADQPNIPRNEVDFIFKFFYAGCAT